MIFKYPQLGWLFLAVIPVVFAMVVNIQIKKRMLSRIIQPKMWQTVVPSLDFSKEIRKKTLLVLCLICCIFAVMQPQFGVRTGLSQRTGNDVIIAIDTSLSMLAEDRQPNRLEFVKKELQSLISYITDDRIGVIVFSKKATAYCPLTRDYSAVQLFLKNVYVGMMSPPGTNMSSAVKLAQGLFKRTPKNHKILILLTDGEQIQNMSPQLIREVKKEGIRIYTVGIGDKKGEPIPIRDENGRIVQYKRDKNNQIVISKLKSTQLIQLADATQGAFFMPTKPNMLAPMIYKQITMLEQHNVMIQSKKQLKNRYQICLIFAFLCLLFEVTISTRKIK